MLDMLKPPKCDFSGLKSVSYTPSHTFDLLIYGNDLRVDPVALDFFFLTEARKNSFVLLYFPLRL